MFEYLAHRYQATPRLNDFTVTGRGKAGLLASALHAFGPELVRAWSGVSNALLMDAIYLGYPIELITQMVALGIPMHELCIRMAVRGGRADSLQPLLDLVGRGEGRPEYGLRSTMYDLFDCRDVCRIPSIYRTLLPWCASDCELDVRYLLIGCLRAMRELHWRSWSLTGSSASEDTPDEGNPALDLLRDIIGRIVLMRGEDSHALLTEGLLSAVRWAPLGAVKALVEEGQADVNACRTEKKGRTALMLVAKKGRPEEMLRYLLRMGADPRVWDNDNNSDALTLATNKRHHHLVSALSPLSQLPTFTSL